MRCFTYGIFRCVAPLVGVRTIYCPSIVNSVHTTPEGNCIVSAHQVRNAWGKEWHISACLCFTDMSCSVVGVAPCKMPGWRCEALGHIDRSKGCRHESSWHWELARRRYICDAVNRRWQPICPCLPKRGDAAPSERTHIDTAVWHGVCNGVRVLGSCFHLTRRTVFHHARLGAFADMMRSA